MEYRKYRGKSLKEARLKMMIDLGNSGYIINQKTIKKLFRKPEYEITAGVLTRKDLDKDDFSKQKAEEIKETIKNDPEHDRNMKKALEVIERNYQEYTKGKGVSKVQKEEIEIDENSPDIQKLIQDKSQPNYSNIQSEIQQLKDIVYAFITKKDPELQEQLEDKQSISSVDILKMILKNKEFDDSFIEKLIEEYDFENEIKLDDEGGINKLADVVSDFLKKKLKTATIDLSSVDSNIIFLVGPTGVGKTTTLAKLGAVLGVFDNLKVKFISTDTFRVGAIQHLKSYSDIMDLPFEKITNAEALQNSLIIDGDYDIIFIDTAGASQKNISEIEKTRKYYEVIKKGKLHVCLVLSATTKYKDMLEIIEKYSILDYSNIIITKLDETNSLGQVASALVTKEKKVSFLSFGQNVPNDIEPAKIDRLVDRITEVLK